MLEKLFSILIVLFFTFTLNAQNKEEKKLIVDNIQTKDARFEEFIKQSNPDSIARLFTPNCHLSVPDKDLIESREVVYDHFRAEFKSGKRYSLFELNADEHKVYKDVILEIGTCHQEYTRLPNKQLIVKNGSYMLVWKKSKKGNFRIRAAFFNDLN